jgi:hypothetical protein
MKYLLSYKGLEISADLFLIENQAGEIIQQFTGAHAYARAVIYAADHKIDGRLYYPLTRRQQRIISGTILKPGRIPGKTYTRRIAKPPSSMRS